MWILVLYSLQDHLLPEELLWEEGVMQLGLRNVEQEVEKPAVVGEAEQGSKWRLSQDTFVAMYNVLGYVVLGFYVIRQ